MVQGGLLPEGAVRVEVVDVAGVRREAAVGRGAWVIVLDGPMHEPVTVRYVDTTGKSVRPALPAAWPREAVPDAVEPCPACGKADWEQITPLDRSRGMHGPREDEMEPTTIVVCRACGHEIPSGGWMAIGDDSATDEELDAQIAAWREELRARDFAVLERLTIPVLIIAGWNGPRSLGGWGGSSGRIDSVTAMHGEPEGPRWVRVELDTDPAEWRSRTVLVRETLSHLVRDDDWPCDRSLPALSVWSAHQDQQAMAIAMSVAVKSRSISVDGSPYTAALAQHEDRTAAILRVPAGQVTIAAAGVAADDLDLTTLTPATALLEER